jgi:hypothetical protein
MVFIQLDSKNNVNHTKYRYLSIHIFNVRSIILQFFKHLGSSEGGTTIVISGDGFSDGSLVQLSGISYTRTNANISYNQISLITKLSPVGVNSLSLYVNGIKALCSSSSCDYEFSSQVAPTLSLISPTSISDAAIVTISGTQFGSDSTKLSVKIGTETCSVTYSTSNSITCSLTGLRVGSQLVIVNLQGVGNAIQLSSRVVVTGIAVVKSSSPNSGSIYGGTLITINGNGFDTIKNTLVSIGTKICIISSLTSSQILCVSPDNLAGTYSIVVM